MVRACRLDHLSVSRFRKCIVAKRLSGSGCRFDDHHPHLIHRSLDRPHHRPKRHGDGVGQGIGVLDGVVIVEVKGQFWG